MLHLHVNIFVGYQTSQINASLTDVVTAFISIDTAMCYL